MAAQIDTASDDYAAKLAKLLPAEGTAALLAVNRLIPDTSSDDAFWVEVIAAVIGIFVILWAWRIRGIHSKLQIGFMFAAYVIWALGIIWDRVTPSYEVLADKGWLPAALAILFTLFVPFAFPSPQQQPAKP